jgi:hypothetical protein
MNEILHVSRQLTNLELELTGSRKKVKLHPFEISTLSNLIRAVSNDIFLFY